MYKNCSLFFALALGIAAQAQQNFSYSPDKPKAGDLITITYVPSGELANTLKKVEGEVYLSSASGRKADDLTLTKNGKKYTTSIKTDTADAFIQLGFYAEKTVDSNFGDGFKILLYSGDKLKKGANFNLSLYYQYYSGAEPNNSKALEALENEIKLYPESKKENAWSYFKLIGKEKKDELTGLVQKEIEVALNAGLKTEKDYAFVESLYSIAKLPEQAKMITSLKKEKFPEGKWQIGDLINKFQSENDIAKKKSLLAEIEKNVATKKDWKSLESSLPYFKSDILNRYVSDKKWDELKQASAQISEAEKGNIASTYNNAAWAMQEKNENLEQAAFLARFATDYTRSEWKNPTSKKPVYLTGKQWAKQRETSYAMYADTYAMVMYRLGKYEDGFSVTKEAAITILKGLDADQNNTYSLLAEKVLPQKQIKTELEQFVRDGKGSAGVKDILKRAYVSEKKSEDGFDAYITALEKDGYLKMLAELKKSMVSESAKPFSLKDMDGNKVSLIDLKGKVVVIDFWATWCGPCKASFPGMQKLVTKFKDNPDVKFVFIDTWERGENKEKEAKDFMTSNKYTFYVLMDNENAVVDQFMVNGIPAKFVLDKEGKIRFKTTGFDGNDDKLIAEVSRMIEMVNSSEGTD